MTWKIAEIVCWIASEDVLKIDWASAPGILLPFSCICKRFVVGKVAPVPGDAVPVYVTE